MRGGSSTSLINQRVSDYKQAYNKFLTMYSIM